MSRKKRKNKSGTNKNNAGQVRSVNENRALEEKAIKETESVINDSVSDDTSTDLQKEIDLIWETAPIRLDSDIEFIDIMDDDDGDNDDDIPKEDIVLKDIPEETAGEENNKKTKNKESKNANTKESVKSDTDELRTDEPVKGESDEEKADDSLAISIKHLSKSYRLYKRGSDRLRESLGLTRKTLSTEKKALDDVSFDVKKGETVGIIGTNGSGKSTILKIITGVLYQTSGDIKVDGRISALLELGAGFNQEYTGLENVYLNGTMMGYTDSEIDEKLDSILEFADIGDYIYQPVKTYSSGMFVRLAFAVAINIDPEILIVDEALSVGDVFFQSKCYHKFEEFKKMGKTILFVSHDLGSISKYCDRVVLLNKGVKLGEGSPKEMIDVYKRVLVGQYDAENGDTTSKESADAKNPNLLEYGDGSAHIDEYYITDEGGIRSSSIVKGSRFTVYMKIKFNRDITSPIFAFSIKNIKGTEITGTNTMFEKAFLEPVSKGDIKEVTFCQEMNLQGGEYLLSLGVTGFEGDDFKVYHRLYDCINITVVSDKDTVGFYDMNSVIKVK